MCSTLCARLFVDNAANRRDELRVEPVEFSLAERGLVCEHLIGSKIREVGLAHRRRQVSGTPTPTPVLVAVGLPDGSIDVINHSLHVGRGFSSGLAKNE
jgi:hypothetical protein